MTAVEIEKADPAVFAFWLRFWRWAIALLEIGGGLFGIYTAVVGRQVGTMHVISVPVIVLFVVAVWAGILLALGRRGGVGLSLGIQALQLVQVATTGFVYSFICGLQLLVGTAQNAPDVNFGFFFGSGFNAGLNPPSGIVTTGAMTGINVVALLAMICLLYVRAEERKAKLQMTANGTADAPQPAGVWPPAPKS